MEGGDARGRRKKREEGERGEGGIGRWWGVGVEEVPVKLSINAGRAREGGERRGGVGAVYMGEDSVYVRKTVKGEALCRP